MCPIRSQHRFEFLEMVRWESVPRGSSGLTWKLSSGLFSRPHWLPLGLRGWDGLSYVQQSTEKATLSVAWNSASGGLAYNWQSKWEGIIAMKTERTQIHFLSDFLVAVASLDLKVLNEKNKTIVSLCTAAPPLKKIGKERLWFTVNNRVQRPRDYFRNVWKMIWLVISHTSLHHWNSEIWLAFICAGFAIGAFCTESFTFVRDNNMMWD